MAILKDQHGTPILDLPFNAAGGEIDAIQRGRKFGRVTGLDAATKTIWTGSMQYIWPSAAVPMSFASTNAADCCSGSVTKAVVFHFLNSSWDQVTEVHCLNGTTPVNLVQHPIRFNRMSFLSNCCTLINTGQLWLGTSDWTSGVPDNKYGHMPSGAGQTYQAFYSTPRGYKAYIYDTFPSVNEGKQSKLEVFVRQHQSYAQFSGFGDGDVKNVYQSKNHLDLFQEAPSIQNKIPRVLNEMSDMEYRAVGEAGGDVDMSVEWSFLLVGSEYYSNPKK